MTPKKFPKAIISFLLLPAFLCVICIVGLLVWKIFLDDQIPIEMLVGTKADTARMLWSGSLSSWTQDVPNGTEMKVFTVQRQDGLLEHRAYLKLSNQKSIYLDVLRAQFPDAPFETVMFTTGTDRFILGWINESIKGDPRSVFIYRINGIRQFDKTGDGKTIIVSKQARIFLVPIFAKEKNSDLWNSITEISIFLDASPPASYERAYTRDFMPSFDISQFFIPVSLKGE